MLLLTLDPHGTTPMFRQIVERIRDLADAGELAEGSRLPPTRTLAERLGVNRSTVLRAYEELWALGYLEARPGSYSTVRRRAPIARAIRASNGFDWASVTTASARDVHRAHVDQGELTRFAVRPGTISLASLAGDRSLAPVGELRRTVAAVLRDEADEVLDYGSPAGHAGLRTALAARLRAHGVSATAENLMITNGAQHAIELVLKLLVAPGRAVVVERPTYSAALPLLRFAGSRIVEVAAGATGLDLDALAARLESERPALVYTMPTFHNPTGVTTSQAHRERLLALCTHAGVPLLEDGFEEELKYFGRAVLPIKSMDASAIVIYLGTVSKVVFPGLRVGWIAAAPACIERLVALNRFSSLSTTTLGQAALARLIDDGRFEAHLRRVHAAYRKRMSTLLSALEREMPPGVSWTRPDGGYTCWVELERPAADEPTLLEACAAERVAVAPGSLFYATPAERLGARVSISNRTEDEIAEGVARLGRALARVMAS